jgi:dipeptidyl aminopeptidase/acylaminoacyl peptidase
MNRCILIVLTTVALPCAATATDIAGKSSPRWDLPMTANAELPPHFRAMALPRADGSTLSAYLVSPRGQSEPKRKPLFVFLQGSGAQSLFMRTPQGLGYGLGGAIAEQVSAQFHPILIEKRGIDFGFSVDTPGSGEGAPREYTRHATLADRVADVRRVLDAMLRQRWVDPTQVVLAGHSEGADVAAAVAAEDPRVTHVAYLGAGGACQFFDLLTLARRQMKAQGASSKEIHAAVEALQRDMRDVLAHPQADDKLFQGHAYRRWSTFGMKPPVENLLKTRARLFLAHGSEDQAVPVEAFDYLVVELLRHRKPDVTIRRVPGGDHGFATPEQPDHLAALLGMIDEVCAWAQANPPTSP